MGIPELIGAFLSILAVVLPVLVLHWKDVNQAKKEATDALVDRDIAALDAGLDRLRKPPIL